MIRKLLIEDPLFWNILRYLESIQRKIPIKIICQELSIKEEQLFRVINYLQNLNYKFYIDKNHDDGPWVIPPNDEAKIKIELTLSEWLALQAHFPVMEKFHEKSYHETLMHKLAQVEGEYPLYDLWSGEWGWPRMDANRVKQLTLLTVFMQDIHKAISHHHLIKLSNEKGCEFIVGPMRLVEIAEEQLLIGENRLNNSELTHYSLIDMTKWSIESEGTFTPKVTEEMVEHYYQRLLSQRENDLRVVLKIFSYQKFNLCPLKVEVKGPYLTTNGNGELIWSGTISVETAFLDWLLQMGQDVEILSPLDVKEKFEGYCKEKLQNG